MLRQVAPNDGAPRARLLGLVIEHIQRCGISDLSLRELAAAIGTSHRMLLYHFGSREGLLVAVVQAVEQAQRDFVADLLADPSASQTELLRTLWQRWADPRYWPNERLFFELYAAALQGKPGTVGLLDDVIDAWVGPMLDLARQHALDVELVEAETRLAIAVVRGLLLDLLATHDRKGVDRAFERYLQLLGAAPL